MQIRVDVGQDGAVTASYTEVPAQTLPVPIHIRAVPVDYFDVRPLRARNFLCSSISHAFAPLQKPPHAGAAV